MTPHLFSLSSGMGCFFEKDVVSSSEVQRRNPEKRREGSVVINTAISVLLNEAPLLSRHNEDTPLNLEENI